jgi:hypothetical protein
MQSFPETFAETIKIVPLTCSFSFGPIRKAFGYARLGGRFNFNSTFNIVDASLVQEYF